MYQLKSKKRIFISQRTTRGTTLRLNFIWSFLLHTPALFWYHFILIFQKVHSLPSWSSIKNIHFSKFYPQQKKKNKKDFSCLSEYRDLNKTSRITKLGLSLSIKSVLCVCVCVCECIYVCECECVWESIPLYVHISRTFETTKIINNSWAWLTPINMPLTCTPCSTFKDLGQQYLLWG